MATITTRAGKGSPLTNAEVDANFTNLNDDKAENGVNADITALSAIATGISSPDYIDFDTAASVTRATARLNWNDTDGCLEVGLKGSDVTQQIGQEMVSYAYNSHTTTINNGELVYFFSNSNGNPAVKRFVADRTLESELVLGVATENITSGSKGYVTEFGIVRGLDTSAFSVGDVLYASASTAGAITNVKPVSPNVVVVVGICLDPNVTNGTIFVKPHKIPDADEIFYDNTESGLGATNVKGAIDELQLNKADISLLQAEVQLYATSAASDIATYNALVTTTTDADFDDTAVDVSTGTITTAETLIASLASDPGILEGDVAATTVTTIGNLRRTAGNGAARFWFEVYHRTSPGTETLIGTGNKTEYTDSETYTQFFDSAFLASQTFTSTDRIVLKFYGQAESQDVTFDFQFGGTSPIRTLFPVPSSLVPTTSTANTITADTTNFNDKLSGSDTTVQAALDTLDDHGHSISEVTDLQTNLDAKLVKADNLSDLANAATARTNLGVAIGTDVLAHDANLQGFVDTFTLPTTDGTDGQVLTTDGLGNITLEDAAGGGITTGKAIAMAIVFGG